MSKQRHVHGTTAYGCLRPAPARRPRRAFLHLRYSIVSQRMQTRSWHNRPNSLETARRSGELWRTLLHETLQRPDRTDPTQRSHQCSPLGVAPTSIFRHPRVQLSTIVAPAREVAGSGPQFAVARVSGYREEGRLFFPGLRYNVTNEARAAPGLGEIRFSTRGCIRDAQSTIAGFASPPATAEPIRYHPASSCSRLSGRSA